MNEQLEPNITVLVPTFNRANFIAECLDSLLAQTVPPKQLLVVNDGSTDQTRAVLEPYMDHIDYLEVKQGGKSRAVNAGLKRVTGDYLWIFDDDDVALPDALERLVAPLMQNPEYGFSYAPYFFTETGDDGKIGEVRSAYTLPDVEEEGFLLTLLRENFLGGATIFARMDCYKRVGGFNVDLVRSQDYEMAIRIARHFDSVLAKGGATFHYRQHKGIRGSEEDHFEKARQKKKWLEYDRKIFRQLYQQMSIEDYLPPGAKTKSANLRQAYIQRIDIMAAKLLYKEVISDLTIIASLSDQSPLSDKELAIIHNMTLHTPFYAWGCIWDRDQVLETLKCLAKDSRTIAQYRAQVAKSLFWRIFKRGLRNIPQEARQLPSRLHTLYAWS